MEEKSLQELTKLSADYNSIDDKISSCLSSTSKNFIEIGFYLNKMKKLDLSSYGYTDIFDYGKERFGFKERSCYYYLAVAERFADNDNPSWFSLKKGFENYNYTQLCELLTVDDADLDKFDPSMKISDIRRVKFENNLKASIQEPLGQAYVPGANLIQNEAESYFISAVARCRSNDYGNFKLVSRNDFSRRYSYDNFKKTYVCCFTNYKKALFNLNFEYSDRDNNYYLYLDYKGCGTCTDEFKVKKFSLKVNQGKKLYIALDSNDKGIKKFIDDYITRYKELQKKKNEEKTKEKVVDEAKLLKEQFTRSFFDKGFISLSDVENNLNKLTDNLVKTIDKGKKLGFLSSSVSKIRIISLDAIEVLLNKYVYYTLTFYNRGWFSYSEELKDAEFDVSELLSSCEFINLQANFIFNKFESYMNECIYENREEIDEEE